eukprot:3934929-Rhodomonas_salina.1
MHRDSAQSMKEPCQSCAVHEMEWSHVKLTLRSAIVGNDSLFLWPIRSVLHLKNADSSEPEEEERSHLSKHDHVCLLYTSDAADDM